MNLKSKLIILSLAAILVIPFFSYAAPNSVTPNANTNGCQVVGNEKLPNCIPKNTIIENLNIVINAIIFISGTVSILFIIIGGFQYVASAGNFESINKAKNTILYAVIGLIVSLVAYAAVKFVIDSLYQGSQPNNAQIVFEILKNKYL